jgi:diacylglycerol kinase (ATP)
MNKLDTEKEFSVIKRAKSVVYASRGVYVFLKTTPNAWIQIFVIVLVALFGFYLRINSTDWLSLIIVCGFVLAAEAFNTAIEIDIDLTSPNYHPYARDTKDVAAGAVLISAITAIIVGIIVFGKYLV